MLASRSGGSKPVEIQSISLPRYSTHRGAARRNLTQQSLREKIAKAFQSGPGADAARIRFIQSFNPLQRLPTLLAMPEVLHPVRLAQPRKADETCQQSIGARQEYCWPDGAFLI
jgi:hypothetical protein